MLVGKTSAPDTANTGKVLSGKQVSSGGREINAVSLDRVSKPTPHFAHKNIQ